MSKNKHLGKSIRKIVQIGESSGITLPKKYFELSELERGDKLEILYSGKTVKLRPLNLTEIKAEGADEGDSST